MSSCQGQKRSDVKRMPIAVLGDVLHESSGLRCRRKPQTGPTTKFRGQIGRARRTPPRRPRDGAWRRCRRRLLVAERKRHWKPYTNLVEHESAGRRRSHQMRHVRLFRFFGRRFLGLARMHTEYSDLHARRGLLAGFFGGLDHSSSIEDGSAERCW